MLILLSPAKNLNESRAAGRASTVPLFLDDAQELMKVMRTWSEGDISKLMDVSAKIAQLNVERFQTWTPASGAAQAAGDMFDGDVYQTLEMSTLGDDTRAAAAQRLRILSGLYGLLTPTDDVCAYRLEMGRKLPGHAAGTLYKFWGRKIADALVADASRLKTNIILNLASEEYSKSVDKAALSDLQFISPRFEEDRAGIRKMISFSAKRARGAMARWALENDVTKAEKLKNFDVDGYAYDAETSTDLRPVFLRVSNPA